MATTSIPAALSDADLEREAGKILADAGMSLPDAYRHLLLRVVSEQSVSLDLFAPNKETLEATNEARAGGLKPFSSLDALMADLNADD